MTLVAVFLWILVDEGEVTKSDRLTAKGLCEHPSTD